MKSMVLPFSVIGFIRAVIAVVCLCSGCAMFNSANDEPLTMRCVTSLGDTISVFPRLQYVFSSPLADSSVAVAFSPSVSARYNAYLNPIRDTLTVLVTGALEGNTRYALRLAGSVMGVNGSRFNPSDDSTVFFTYPFETEPNDTRAGADTFSSTIFGTISEVTDIDVFADMASQSQAVCLQSIDCQDSFYVVDAASRLVSLSWQMKQIDTLRLPDDIARPLYVFVCSRSNKGSAGNYRLYSINR
jgi:hypothetical protein